MRQSKHCRTSRKNSSNAAGRKHIQCWCKLMECQRRKQYLSYRNMNKLSKNYKQCWVYYKNDFMYNKNAAIKWKKSLREANGNYFTKEVRGQKQRELSELSVTGLNHHTHWLLKLNAKDAN